MRWLLPLGIAICVLIAFLPILDSGKQFTNWDDNQYVTEQPLVKQLNEETVSAMFDTSTQVAANYHPLTMLTLAIDYELFGDTASAFARTNLMFHILNTLLVFLLVRLLLPQSMLVAGFTALLFGVHPMHVESVAWISERKDVLYTMFLLLSMISYVKYASSQKIGFLLLTFVMFVMSVLSKAMATPLPVMLFVIDYYYRRPLNGRTILEKLPMLAFAVWMGLIAYKFQSAEAITKADPYSLVHRIAFAGYGFVMYWVKMIAPFDLSALYPYPALVNGGIPTWYYVMPVIALGMVVAPIIALRKHPETQRLFILCMGLFILFVALVLQFVSVGQVIMAERYTYVPYVGSLLLLSFGIWKLQQRQAMVGWALGATLALVFIVVTRSQASIWKTSETLWSNVIDIHGTRAIPAYESRALHNYLNGQKDQAFRDLQVLEYIGTDRWRTYQLLGILYGERGQMQKSLKLLNRANELQPNHPRVLLNRAVTHSSLGNTVDALRDYKDSYKALLKDKGPLDKASAYSASYGAAVESLKVGEYSTAIDYSNKAIAIDSQNPSSYITLGIAQFLTRNLAPAKASLETAKRLGANSPILNQYLARTMQAMGS